MKHPWKDWADFVFDEMRTAMLRMSWDFLDDLHYGRK